MLFRYNIINKWRANTETGARLCTNCAYDRVLTSGAMVFSIIVSLSTSDPEVKHSSVFLRQSIEKTPLFRYNRPSELIYKRSMLCSCEAADLI